MAGTRTACNERCGVQLNTDCTQTTLAGIISILLLTCMLGCLITLPIPFAVSEFKLGMVRALCPGKGCLWSLWVATSRE